MKGKWNTLTIMHVLCGKYTISELVYPELVFARQSTQKSETMTLVIQYKFGTLCVDWDVMICVGYNRLLV